MHQSSVDSPHKGHWRGTSMLSLIWAQTNDWANHRVASQSIALIMESLWCHRRICAPDKGIVICWDPNILADDVDYFTMGTWITLLEYLQLRCLVVVVVVTLFPAEKQSTTYMSKDTTSVNQYHWIFCWWSPEKPKAHLAGVPMYSNKAFDNSRTERFIANFPQCVQPRQHPLSHWGRVTHICVSKLTIIGSDNGLSPGRRQAIIWTNGGVLLIRPLGTKCSEIWSKIHTFSFEKMHLKTSSAKWRPFCLGLNVLYKVLECALLTCLPN